MLSTAEKNWTDKIHSRKILPENRGNTRRRHLQYLREPKGVSPWP